MKIYHGSLLWLTIDTSIIQRSSQKCDDEGSNEAKNFEK
jgi:hypothetical protein